MGPFAADYSEIDDDDDHRPLDRRRRQPAQLSAVKVKTGWMMAMMVGAVSPERPPQSFVFGAGLRNTPLHRSTSERADEEEEEEPICRLGARLPIIGRFERKQHRFSELSTKPPTRRRRRRVVRLCDRMMSSTKCSPWKKKASEICSTGLSDGSAEVHPSSSS